MSERAADEVATDTAAQLQAAVTPASRRRLGALRQLAPFIAPYRGRMVVALLLLLASSAAFLGVPLAFRGLIDHGFVGGGAIGGHFLGLFGIALIWGAASAGRFYQVSWIGERVTADLRSAVYRSMLSQSPQYFETTQTGEVLSRLTGDTTLVQTVVGSSLSMGLRSFFQFAGGLVMMLVVSPKLFSVTLVLLIVVVVPLVWTGRRLRKLSRESQDRIADSSAVAGEVLNAIPTVQSYTNEPFEQGRFDRAVENSFTSAIRRTRVRALLTGGMIGGVFGAIVFVLWLGAQAVVGGAMTGGALASFVMYAGITAGGVGVLA
jgi:ATP-binding cassette subfamily B protein